jgi:hypothetical protein
MCTSSNTLKPPKKFAAIMGTSSNTGNQHNPTEQETPIMVTTSHIDHALTQQPSSCQAAHDILAIPCKR